MRAAQQVVTLRRIATTRPHQPFAIKAKCLRTWNIINLRPKWSHRPVLSHLCMEKIIHLGQRIHQQRIHKDSSLTRLARRAISLQSQGLMYHHRISRPILRQHPSSMLVLPTRRPFRTSISPTSLRDHQLNMNPQTDQHPSIHYRVSRLQAQRRSNKQTTCHSSLDL